MTERERKCYSLYSVDALREEMEEGELEEGKEK